MTFLQYMWLATKSLGISAVMLAKDPSGPKYAWAMFRGGIDLWVKPPAKLDLEVISVRDVPCASRVAGDGEESAPTRNLKFIVVRCSFGDDGRTGPDEGSIVDDGRTKSVEGHIAIDADRRTIDRSLTSGWLIGENHAGCSAEIGLFVVTALPMLLISPGLLAASAYYRLLERRHGMSRDGIALLAALDGKLDSETTALLADALKKDWARRQRLMNEPTFAEAKELLSRCHLVEETSTIGWWAGRGQDGTVPRELGWVDEDGNVVASAVFYGEHCSHFNVLGFPFESDGAGALAGCYRTREVLRHGEREAEETD